MAATSSIMRIQTSNLQSSRAWDLNTVANSSRKLPRFATRAAINPSSWVATSTKRLKNDSFRRESLACNFFGDSLIIHPWDAKPEFARRPRLDIRAADKDSKGDKDDVPSFKGFPPMQEKPKWHWRLLSCIPYVLPFCEGWLYAKPAFYLFPGLRLYETFTMPVWQVIGKLPGWFLIVYILTAYTLIVRNNRWPHFLRFHVVNGMLLEIFLQAIGILNDWIPRSIYWGLLGRHFWLFMSISYFFTVSLCIMYALRGMYADVPFTSDASYMQIPYE